MGRYWKYGSPLLPILLGEREFTVDRSDYRDTGRLRQAISLTRTKYKIEEPISVRENALGWTVTVLDISKKDEFLLEEKLRKRRKALESYRRCKSTNSS